MSQLLMWAMGEIQTFDSRTEFSLRKKKPPVYEEEQPTDIFCYKTTTGIPCEYCPTCNKQVDGNPCGLDEKCPW